MFWLPLVSAKNSPRAMRPAASTVAASSPLARAILGLEPAQHLVALLDPASLPAAAFQLPQRDRALALVASSGEFAVVADEEVECPATAHHRQDFLPQGAQEILEGHQTGRAAEDVVQIFDAQLAGSHSDRIVEARMHLSRMDQSPPVAKVVCRYARDVEAFF